MSEFHYCGIHRSCETIREISDSGEFGGLFAGPIGGMYGHVDHEIYSPRHLTDYELNYSTELNAWDVALEICEGDA